MQRVDEEPSGHTTTKLTGEDSSAPFKAVRVWLAAVLFLLVSGCGGLQARYNQVCDNVYILGTVLNTNLSDDDLFKVDAYYRELFELCFEEEVQGAE